MKARDVCVFVQLYGGAKYYECAGRRRSNGDDVLASAIRLFVLYG